MSDATSTTRGGVLKRLALAAGGVAGLAYAGRETLGHDTVAAQAPVSKDGRQTLVLRASDFRLTVPGAVPGELPPAGIVAVPEGRLVDRKGRTLGSFSGANLPGVGAALQLHTFDLADGTILGIGAAGAHQSPFTIVGGTGRYANASGTYVAKQSPRELGGDGTAEFTLTLSA